MFTLTRYGSALENIQNQHVWPIKIVAVSDNTTLLPSEIFVYQAAQKRDPFYGDRYNNVAKIQDISGIGLTPKAVNGELQIPFYRSATLQVNCLTACEADQLWELVQEDVGDLVANYNATVDLQAVATATI